MSSSSDKVIVRRATHQDYEAVMDINRDVYVGFDYLSSKYFELLGDPRFHLFLAEINGKVVGFSGVEVSADGKRFLGFAGRTHPDYQRRGISGTIESAYKTALKARYPSAQWSTFTAIFSDSHQVKLAKGPRELLHQWNYLPYRAKNTLTKSSLRTLQKTRHCPHLLNDSEAISLLMNESNQRKLFKDFTGFVTSSYWHPHMFNLSDIKLAVHHANVRATFCPSNNNSSSSSSSSLIGLSFDHMLPYGNKDAGARIDIYYYGVNDEKADTLVSHVASALDHYLNITSFTNFQIIVAFPVALKRVDIVSRLVPVLGFPLREGPFLYDYAASFRSRL